MTSSIVSRSLHPTSRAAPRRRFGIAPGTCVVALLGAGFLTGAATGKSFYIRGSGVYTEPDDAKFDDVDGRVGTALGGIDFSGGLENLSFDDDWGYTIAIGQKFGALPLAIELEYGYSSPDVTTLSSIAGPLEVMGEYETHSLSVNAVLDFPSVFGPVGFYAGAGAGVAISTFDVTTIDGSSVSGIITDDPEAAFRWQAMAGVSVTFAKTFQLYGGVRYSDLAELDFGEIEARQDDFDFEIGVKIYF